MTGRVGNMARSKRVGFSIIGLAVATLVAILFWRKRRSR